MTRERVRSGVAAATDDCAGKVELTHTAPRRFPVGTTAVTWTATDPFGNQATAAQLVTVVDTVADRRVRGFVAPF